MISMRWRGRLVLVFGLSFASAAVAAAQPVGVFRWQLQPYCNVVTLAVTQNGGLFTLDGADDQCGAGQRASIVGTAFLNPDGTIGIGLTTVVAPGGTPVHIDARISLASLNGPWRDSAGNSGTFVFTPGPGTGGPPRPVAPNGLPPGSITAAQLAPGAVGAAHANLSQLQARVGGSCPVGQYLRGINANGTVVCEPLLTPNASTLVDEDGSTDDSNATAIGADGLPIISHYNADDDALRVTRCGNAACTVGTMSRNVDDPASNVGRFSSIAIGSDGRPIISHYNSTLAALRVTRCGNAACTTGNVSVTVDDPANSVGLYTSIAIGADGLPVISYRDSTAHALRITHCGNAPCTAGNVSTTVDDPASDVGAYSSLAIGADGLPIIGHRNATAGALRVTHCGNPTCTAGNASHDVDVGGLDPSIAVGADGLPVISHIDFGVGLRVTHCGNTACTAGNVSTLVVQGLPNVAQGTSIAIGADGLPAIAYRGSTGIRVVHCGNVACTAGNVDSAINSVSDNVIAGTTSLAIGTDGLPVVSYLNLGLRVTKCATKTCQ